MRNTATFALDREMLPPVQAAPDRLPPMLFLAALFHAIVILGVTFDPDLDFDDGHVTTLDVVIVADPDQHIERPDEAAYLAQANQEGGGNTRSNSQPAAMAPGLAAQGEVAEVLGDVAPESIPEEHRAAYLTTTASNAYRRERDPDPVTEPADRASTEASLPRGAEHALPLPSSDHVQPDVRDDNPRELVFSVDTQESALAGYLAAWKSRVETIGTDYYNREVAGGEGVYGSPTIEVAIGANGDLEEIIVRQSSGSGRIDQAALNVLRRAAPYDPIPPALRADFDVLRFEYRFEFRQSRF